MATCINCRKAVSWSADRCAYCGVVFQPGTWRMQTDLLDQTSAAWGLAPATYPSAGFRLGALLCPVWLPLGVGLVAGPQPRADPTGLALLLALFIFIPGVYVLANTPSWGRLLRAVACAIYVVLSEVVAFWVLLGVNYLWRA